MTIIHWEVDKSHQKRDYVKDRGSLRGKAALGIASAVKAMRKRASANQEVRISSSDSKHPDNFDLIASLVSVRCI